jgi:hypothetical protein
LSIGYCAYLARSVARQRSVGLGPGRGRLCNGRFEHGVCRHKRLFGRQYRAGRGHGRDIHVVKWRRGLARRKRHARQRYIRWEFRTGFGYGREIFHAPDRRKRRGPGRMHSLRYTPVHGHNRLRQLTDVLGRWRLVLLQLQGVHPTALYRDNVRLGH